MLICDGNFARKGVASPLAGMLASVEPAQACTNILMIAADGTPVYGRTLE